jgi:SNF2 family DNA or RNA helicase
MGITLTAASTCVFYSLSYNYADYIQAKARIHRIGQKNKCVYIHLVAKGTIDETVLTALQKKEDIAHSIVDNWKNIIK